MHSNNGDERIKATDLAELESSANVLMEALEAQGLKLSERTFLRDRFMSRQLEKLVCSEEDKV